MLKFPYIEPGTYLFRFMDHRADHFWPTVGDLLSQNKLFLNSRTKFNDPFDSQPIIEDDLTNSSIRKYFNHVLEDPFNPNRSAISTARILEMKATGRTHLTKKSIQEIKTELFKNAHEFLDTAGLLSFSLTADNPLLWGHYAASFSGICAVFRRGTSADSALSVCATVTYVDRRPRLLLSLLHRLATLQMDNLPYDRIADEVFYLAFLHKSGHWAHEREARIYFPFNALKKLPFKPDELVGFILGPKSSEDLEMKMRDQIGALRPSISLDRSTLSENDFRIVIPHRFVRQHAHAA
jgi:hypothetical protein